MTRLAPKYPVTSGAAMSHGHFLQPLVSLWGRGWGRHRAVDGDPGLVQVPIHWSPLQGDLP